MKKLVRFILVVFVCGVIALPASYVLADEITDKTAKSSIVDADTNADVTELKTNDLDITLDEANYKSYFISIPYGQSIVVPITLNEEGRLNYRYDFENEYIDQKSYYCEVYTDAACTKKANYYNYDTYSGELNVSIAGIYYVKFSVIDTTAQPNAINYIKFSSFYINSRNETLTNGKQVVSAFLGYDKKIYYKVIVSDSGSISLNMQASTGGNVILCNSKKKEISNLCRTEDNNHTFVFAVSKGTYYLKVTTSSNYAYVMQTFKEIEDKSAPSKQKAKTLEVGGDKLKSLALSTEKSGKADWFKFKNDKKRKIIVDVIGMVSCGGLKIDFYDTKGTKWESRYFYPIDNANGGVSTIYYILDGTEKLPKGTYYIRISKISTKTNAIYRVGVRNK
ncbi:hypothetical protein [Anaerosporobacter sp.]